MNATTKPHRNRSNARGYKTADGWIAQFRLVWRANYEDVVDIDDATGDTKPRIFETEEAAECVGWRVLRDISEPVIVCSGPLPSLREIHRQAADRKFKAVTA